MPPETPDVPVPDSTPPALDPAPSTLTEATQDLEMLRKSRKHRALNEALLQYLTVVFHAYKNLVPPAEADEDARVAFEKDRNRFRVEAEKAFLKCLTLVKVSRGQNVREDVNILAAMTLGRLPPYLDARRREGLSRKIRRAVEKDFTKVKTHEISADLLNQTFVALARLNSPKSLEWMLKEYVHTRVRDVALLIAAHRAMPIFEAVPGRLRHEIVLAFIKAYVGVEMQAAQSSSDPVIQARGRFWEQVGPGAVAVVQHYARKPEDDEGRPLTTMGAMYDWYRDHRSPRKPPWTDPEDSK